MHSVLKLIALAALGEGPNRGLLRDCENFADGSFISLQTPLQGASAAGAAGADPAGQGAAGGAAAGGRHHRQGGAHAGQQRGRAQHRHRREDRHRHQPAQLRRVEDEGRGLMFVLEYRYDTYDIWFYYSFPKVFIYFCVI